MLILNRHWINTAWKGQIASQVNQIYSLGILVSRNVTNVTLQILTSITFLLMSPLNLPLSYSLFSSTPYQSMTLLLPLRQIHRLLSFDSNKPREPTKPDPFGTHALIGFIITEMASLAINPYSLSPTPAPSLNADQSPSEHLPIAIREGIRSTCNRDSIYNFLACPLRIVLLYPPCLLSLFQTCLFLTLPGLRQAMEDEMFSFHINGTWVVVLLPASKNVVGS